MSRKNTDSTVATGHANRSSRRAPITPPPSVVRSAIRRILAMADAHKANPKPVKNKAVDVDESDGALD